MIFFKTSTIYHLLRSLLLSRESENYIKRIQENQSIDLNFYKSQRPRNLAAQFNPVAHYILWGEAQGLWPNPNFSPRDYIANNPEHAHEITYPLWHYLEQGKALRLATTPQPTAPSKLLADLKVALSQAISRPFAQEITLREDITGRNRNHVIFYSHYDSQSIVDDHVIYSINHLSQYADIVFVSTSELLAAESLDRIRAHCRTIIIKKNEGYDFGAWKTGMDAIRGDLDQYDKLILCNDSVYGPFYPLDDFFDKMDTNQYDVFAMTQSHDIIEHNQSYFTAYGKKAFSTELFKEFWENMVIYDDKKSLILSHEIIFSNSLIQSDFNVGSYMPLHHNARLNITHFEWKNLIIEKGFPFLKVELLRDNPMRIDISDWKKTVSSVSDYDTNLISNHLRRIKAPERGSFDFIRSSAGRVWRRLVDNSKSSHTASG